MAAGDDPRAGQLRAAGAADLKAVTPRGAPSQARHKKSRAAQPSPPAHRRVGLCARQGQPIYFLPPALNSGLEWSFACPGLGSGESLFGALGGGIGGGAGVAGGASCTVFADGAAVDAGGGVLSGLLHPAAKNERAGGRKNGNESLHCISQIVSEEPPEQCADRCTYPRRTQRCRRPRFRAHRCD